MDKQHIFDADSVRDWKQHCDLSAGVMCWHCFCPRCTPSSFFIDFLLLLLECRLYVGVQDNTKVSSLISTLQGQTVEAVKASSVSVLEMGLEPN